MRLQAKTGCETNWLGDYHGAIDVQESLLVSFADNSSGSSQTIFYPMSARRSALCPLIMRPIAGR
jgi:hypothetical protein